MMDNNNKYQQPQPWPPYYSQDCSQGYCSYYCPQFCFFLFPPPPPPSPSPHLLISPILIAVIAIISAAFLLVAYYILLTAYRRRHNLISSTNSASPENHPATAAAAWHPSHSSSGLDDSIIEKIAACRYQSGTGLLVDGTDCSVCLSSFEDGDRIRFLPKCSHAFHVPCIDTWLKSHSNCPLCRAGVLPLSLLPPASAAGDQNNTADVAVVVVQEPSETSAAHNENDEVGLSHDVVEIIDVEGRGGRLVGRSLSMDFEVNVNRTDCDMVSPVRLNRSWSMRSSTSSSGRGRRSEVLPT